MKADAKYITVATILELAVRTSAKVAIANTRRGFGDLSTKMYDDATNNLRDELVIRGATNV